MPTKYEIDTRVREVLPYITCFPIIPTYLRMAELKNAFDFLGVYNIKNIGYKETEKLIKTLLSIKSIDNVKPTKSEEVLALYWRGYSISDIANLLPFGVEFDEIITTINDFFQGKEKFQKPKLTNEQLEALEFFSKAIHSFIYMTESAYKFNKTEFETGVAVYYNIPPI